MARDIYETIIAITDAGNDLNPLSGVKVTVVPRGAADDPVNAVDIFQADTGISKGPSPATGATGTNPFTTGATGLVRFWAEGPAELDVIFDDTNVPARISDRIGWNAVPAKSGSMATSILAPDGGIKLSMLGAEVKRQLTQIGEVIEWWRPSDVVPVPAGFEICDGHSVTQHDFVGFSGSITLPDLRHTFVLGADPTKTQGTASAADDVATGGPGIGGTGGSNQHTLLQAQLPAVGLRPAATPNHSLGQLSFFQRTTSGGPAGTLILLSGPNGVNWDESPTTEPMGGGQAHNNMPKWVGLLRLMKVRAS